MHIDTYTHTFRHIHFDTYTNTDTYTSKHTQIQIHKQKEERVTRRGREVKPGEIITISDGKLKQSYFGETIPPAFCIFEVSILG